MWKTKKTIKKKEKENKRKRKKKETQKLKFNDHYNKERRPASFRK